MNKPFPVLGFDIGGTKIAICLAMSDGTVVASGRVDNKMKKPDEVLPQVVAEGERIRKIPGDRIGLDGGLDVPRDFLGNRIRKPIIGAIAPVE